MWPSILTSNFFEIDAASPFSADKVLPMRATLTIIPPTAILTGDEFGIFDCPGDNVRIAFENGKPDPDFAGAVLLRSTGIGRSWLCEPVMLLHRPVIG